MIKTPKNYFELAETLVEEAELRNISNIIILNSNNSYIYSHSLITGQMMQIESPKIGGKRFDKKAAHIDIISLSKEEIKNIEYLRSHIESGCNIYLCAFSIKVIYQREIESDITYLGSPPSFYLFKYAIGLHELNYMNQDGFSSLGVRVFIENDHKI